METQYKKIKSINKLEDISSDMCIMDVVFTDNTSAKYVSSYSNALNFLDKDVAIELRDDLFHGRVEKFISTLSVTTVATTLDRDTNFKLYSEDAGQIYSTIAFPDIPDSGVMGAIMFCTNVKLERSDKSTWFRFTCLDRNRKSCNVRLFDPIRDTANFIGRYVKMDIRKGKFDYIATKVSIEMGTAPEANPEIRVARAFILDIIKDYPTIMDFVTHSNILDYIEKYNIDEEIEPGYEMVRLAIELEQIRNFNNITNGLDVQAMMKACILYRGYCISDNDSTVKSKPLQNIYVAIQNNGIKSKMEMHLLDRETELRTAEYELLNDIRGIADKIVKVNRTYFYDKIK